MAGGRGFRELRGLSVHVRRDVASVIMIGGERQIGDPPIELDVGAGSMLDVANGEIVGFGDRNYGPWPTASYRGCVYSAVL